VFSVFDTPLAQHALSPANALDARSIAAATNAETVILIMVNAQTGIRPRAYNHSGFSNMAGANSFRRENKIDNVCYARTCQADRTLGNSRSAQTNRSNDRSYTSNPARARTGLSRHPPETGESATDQRLQVARRRQCRGDAVRVGAQAWRVDNQRGKCRTGRGLRGETSGRTVHRCGDRDGAGIEDRANAIARRKITSSSVRHRLESARRPRVPGSGWNVHPSIRRSQFHRGPRNDGPGDS